MILGSLGVRLSKKRSFVPLECGLCVVLAVGCSNGAGTDAPLDDVGLGAGGSDATGGAFGASGSGPAADGSGGADATGGATSSSGGVRGSTGGAPGIPGDPSERLFVEGGSYLMGRSAGGSDACPEDQTCAPGEVPEHEVSVSDFWLDRFEVTVERFRAFYAAYPVALPAEGAGAHPLIAGSGWVSGLAVGLPDSQEDLLADLACGEHATFTASAGSREDFPVSCVSWPVAFLFCFEVGGRLPTEAEWERAAAGGDENRLYPWGADAPDASQASFFPSDLGAVGAHPMGKGRYGHEDLAGSVWEWSLDWLDTNWYSGSGDPCADCARVSSGTHRVLRGGAHSFDAVALRAAVRSGEVPEARMPSIGFRCAYDSAGN